MRLHLTAPVSRVALASGRSVFTRAPSQVEQTEPWRVEALDTSTSCVHVDEQRAELDPVSGLRHLHLGQTISLDHDAVPRFSVGQIAADGALQPPAAEAGVEAAAEAVAEGS